MPNLYIIGGRNGAGKTTTAFRLLPDTLACMEYVNADAIAAGLSPFNPDGVAIQAGKLMIERINRLAISGVDFAFETTLASKMFEPLIQRCQQNGYAVTLIYFWLNSAGLAIDRVGDRVRRGGHHIPEAVIRRRYEVSRKNFATLYLPLVDNFLGYDNSDSEPILVCKKANNEIIIFNEEIWIAILT
ncbi:MAG: Zeta toxin family protein [[Candidatus Thermochlorobacteriaceae] bacterium GBChlB]|nr:MAG: Zeta toxin family protein [[Candidatus Thermochlorobacteriaceae] bacterium GBChlB]